MPSPTWYDLLAVDADASEDEVRAAWKAAIADLDPTDRRFRVVNEAAEVLLDPARRAAYDAELAARATPGDDASPQVVSAPAGRDDVRGTATAKAEHPIGAGATSAPEERRDGAVGRTVPGWLLGAVAVLAAAAVGLAAWLATGRAEDDRVVEATEAARAAAVPAAEAVLSYGYDTLDEDQAAAQSYLTDDYREKYDGLFEVIRQNAPGTETTVRASVIASGIVRSGEDRVQVLLFVNQTRTNADTEKGGEPTVFKNWATVTLEEVDGDWLVDDMTSTPAGG
ncbi:J domain-containing protein [Nocardioides ferulae]|uniref:J domain-containing protein n=1 Tax=Nocardioides ferulae TaxID=2340821 RepID=UPI0013DE1117|nr:DnaJ domain-containing protein [Nocardioides ferulae]